MEKINIEDSEYPKVVGEEAKAEKGKSCGSECSEDYPSGGKYQMIQ